MIRLTNYTQNTELEITDTTELTDYMEAHEDQEIELFCPALALNSTEEAVQYLELEEDIRDRLEAFVDYHGYSYFNSLDDALEKLEDGIGMTVNGVSNSRELAKALEYELGYEEELYQVLGCTKEAYEQLSSFIRTDDVAYTIDQEFSFYYVNNTAYEVLNN